MAFVAFMAKTMLFLNVFENNADEIVPNLWIGNIASAYDLSFLQEKGITTIVAITDFGTDACFYKGAYLYNAITLQDLPFVNLLVELQRHVPFLISVMSDPRQRVLVHCMFGRSRSVSLVAAYLMVRYHINASQALQRIRTYRPQANPNPGFMQHLADFSAMNIETQTKAPKQQAQLTTATASQFL